MSTGDQSDLFSRITALLPNGWFGDNTLNPYDATATVDTNAATKNAGYVQVPDSSPPLYAWCGNLTSSLPRAYTLTNIQSLCIAAANMLSSDNANTGERPGVYGQYADAVLQTRIKTATGGWLDMLAGDFFGNTLKRQSSTESDTLYRARILSRLSAEKGTRAAVIGTVSALTGVSPAVFELGNPADTGAYGVACGYGGAGVSGAEAASTGAGGWSNLDLPYTFFVRVPSLAQTASSPCNGYGQFLSGYGISNSHSPGYPNSPVPAGNAFGISRYGDMTEFDNYITRAAICGAVNNVRPTVSTGWIGIAS